MSGFWFVALIPLVPAIGVLLNGLVGPRWFRKKLAHRIACGSVLVSFVLAVVAFAKLLTLGPGARTIELVYYKLLSIGGLDLDLKFLLDPLSCAMILMVTGVGFLIHVYSVGYMAEDRDYIRFFTYLNLFMAAMLTLVLGGNFVVMFIGWEGVGLCSYLLIGFWYEKESAANAGKKAFVVNRIGDFGFLTAMFWIYSSLGSLDFLEVFSKAPQELALGSMTITAITLLLFVGATGKSAQLPLYVWLPDAMEGPTPVSALIHAATMVTAGVYMVARCHILFLLAPFSLGVVAMVGAGTAIFAASIALVQNDIKKVLAYSTISQLGYMFLGCGAGAFTAGVFHLITHAFFKALLFLGSGSVIHAMHHVLHHDHDAETDPQDMRNMGGLRNALPWTFWTFLIASLAIAGIPPLSGFFSKDEILWNAFAGSHGHWMLWLVGAIAAGMTAFYMFRLVFLTFFGKPQMGAKRFRQFRESPLTMIAPLGVLAVLAAGGGLLNIPLIPGANFFHRFLEPVFADSSLVVHAEHHAVSLEVLLMVVSVGVALIGITISYVFYLKNPQLPRRLANQFKLGYQTLLHKYWVDEIYSSVFVTGTKAFGNLLWHFDHWFVDGIVNGAAFLTKVTARLSALFDGKIVDGIVNGSGAVVDAVAVVLRRVQTGYIHNYGFIMVIGACVLLLIAFL